MFFGSSEYEDFSRSGDTCKVKTFKKVATSLGYQSHLIASLLLQVFTV